MQLFCLSQSTNPTTPPQKQSRHNHKNTGTTQKRINVLWFFWISALQMVLSWLFGCPNWPSQTQCWSKPIIFHGKLCFGVVETLAVDKKTSSVQSTSKQSSESRLHMKNACNFQRPCLLSAGHSLAKCPRPCSSLGPAILEIPMMRVSRVHKALNDTKPDKSRHKRTLNMLKNKKTIGGKTRLTSSS